MNTFFPPALTVAVCASQAFAGQGDVHCEFYKKCNEEMNCKPADLQGIVWFEEQTLKFDEHVLPVSTMTVSAGKLLLAAVLDEKEYLLDAELGAGADVPSSVLAVVKAGTFNGFERSFFGTCEVVQ